MDSAYGYLIAFLALSILIVIGIGYYLAKSLHKHVEDALRDATTEEQEIIRNKVVKALFPPRFDRS